MINAAPNLITRRSAWITFVDALLIVFASAAIVIWLGGRTKLTVLGTRVLIESAWRPALIAVALAIVRLATTRRVPFLTTRVERDAIDYRLRLEREPFVRAPVRPSGFWWYAAAAVAGSWLWLTPHLLHPRGVSDPGDPVFSAWRLGRFAQQLAHDPTHLFDGRIFYPATNTLLYSDATVLEALVAVPFILGGADPLLVCNLIFLAALPLNALAFFYAGWRLTRNSRAALVSGLLGALYPFHWEHYSHLELQFTCFIPLAVVALVGVLAQPTIRRGVALGSLVTLQWLACMYFGLMLITFLVPLAIVIALGWRVRPTGAMLKSAACAAAVIAVGFAALGLPYMHSRTARGERTIRFVADFSATADEYLHPSGRLAAYRWISRDQNRLEREMFPGVAILALAAIGAAPPLGTVSIACITSGALALDWSFGMNGLTYDDIYRWVLPFRSMRVPSRFSIFVGSALVLLAAFGSARLFAFAANRRLTTAVFVLVVSAVLLDMRPRLELVTYWRSLPSVYATVTEGMVLAEFPFDNNVDYMYFSLSHRAHLLNGYSGFVPRPYIAVQYQLEDFPSSGSLDVLRRTGVTHVTVNCRFYGARCPRVVEGLDADTGVRLMASGKWEGAMVRLYALLPPNR